MYSNVQNKTTYQKELISAKRINESSSKSNLNNLKTGEALTNLRRKTAEKKKRRRELLCKNALPEMTEPRGKKYIETIQKMKGVIIELTEEESRLEELENSFADIQKKVEIQNTIYDLKVELEHLQETICKLLPKGDELISLLFLDYQGEKLIQRGIIANEGQSYSSLEELYEYANAYTEEEQRALALGNQLLWEEPTPLVVEVFAHVVNQVYENGEVRLWNKFADMPLE